MTDHICAPLPQLGIASLDLDHARAHEVLHSLRTHILSEDESDDSVLGLIHQFIDQMAVHYDTEELLMQLYDYPGADAHRRTHAIMMAKARQLMDILEAGGRHALPPAIEGLYTWMVNHVKVEDTRLGIFLSRLGVFEAHAARPNLSA